MGVSRMFESKHRKVLTLKYLAIYLAMVFVESPGRYFYSIDKLVSDIG